MIRALVKSSHPHCALKNRVFAQKPGILEDDAPWSKVMKRKNVPVMVPLDFAYGRAVVRGISRYARSRTNWDLAGSGDFTLDTLREYRRKECDGMIIFAGPLGRWDIWKAAQAMPFPTVNVAARLSPPLKIPSVIPDNRSIGRIVAEYFLSRGHRHFAFCGFADHYYSEERYEGFRQTLTKAGHDCQKFVWHSGEDESRETQWLQSLPKPMAVMACSDFRGIRFIRKSEQLGLRVPEEIAVIGVDDDDLLCEQCKTPLASVNPQADRIGYMAAELLDRMMAGRKAPKLPVLVPPAGVVVRDSADVLAVEDPHLAQVISYIRENAQRSINMKEVLSAVPVARRSLEIQFRQCLGLTPARYLRRVRIEKARALLTDTGMTLPEIARECGFSSADRLNEAFRRETGTTPGRFRRKTRQSVIPEL
jgi:LacI family transcriptional regulator